MNPLDTESQEDNIGLEKTQVIPSTSKQVPP